MRIHDIHSFTHSFLHVAGGAAFICLSVNDPATLERVSSQEGFGVYCPFVFRDLS